MDFHFDAVKSESNKGKHGIDFRQAALLWEDDRRIEIPARTLDEPRIMVIATIDGVHWSAIITYRDAAIRIISVRRSRREEVRLYEDQGR